MYKAWVMLICVSGVISLHSMDQRIEGSSLITIPSLRELAARVVIEKSKTDRDYARTLVEKIPTLLPSTQNIIKALTGVPQRLDTLMLKVFSKKKSYSPPFRMLTTKNTVLMSATLKQIPVACKPGELLKNLCWTFHADRFAVCLFNPTTRACTWRGYDAYKEKEIFEVENVHRVAWSFSGNKVLIKPKTESDFIINFISGTTCKLPKSSLLSHYFWSPDDSSLMCIDETDLKASYTNSAYGKVFDTTTGKLVRVIKPFFMFPSAAGWSRDGSRLVITGSKNYMPLAIEIAAYDMIHRREDPFWQSSLLADEYVSSVEWSPNGRFILLNSTRLSDHCEGVKISIFESATGKMVKRLKNTYMWGSWQEDTSLLLVKRSKKGLVQLRLSADKEMLRVAENLSAAHHVILMNHKKGAPLDSSIPESMRALWE